ncbi:hypothetical protein [Cupriavidus sp. TMH.W2]|uniref:hypothetical protein n=1 Tax=Cupriavidus sp. TMH.W2 TaxID=3434465 RepID=UPI003D77AAD1
MYNPLDPEFRDMIPPSVFQGKGFEEAYKTAIGQYAALRAYGRTSRAALRMLWGDKYADHARAQAYIDRIECAPLYIRQFKYFIESLAVSSLWNERVAANRLLNIINDPETKDSTCLAAIKELNVLTGITVIDEKGNTRSRKTLDEFYAMEAAQRQADAESGAATQH